MAIGDSRRDGANFPMQTNTLATQPSSKNTGQPFQPKVSALSVMASRFSVEPAKLLNTLKNTVFKGATDDELLALVVVANEYGLNPLTKEIYAFPAKSGGIVPVVSVDGWNNLANSHPQMDGLEFEFVHDEKGALISCTCVIWRKDRARPIKVTEYLSECRRNTEPWKMEHRMLRHKALIQCARVAFGFSGISDEDDGNLSRPGFIDVPAADVPIETTSAKPATKPNETVADADFTLDTSAPSPHEQLAIAMREAGVVWTDIASAAEAGGLFIDPNAQLKDVPEDAVRDVLSVFGMLVDSVKGGAK